MPSTYTTRNRLEKQAAGENSNTWGIRLNTNVIDLLDFASDGMTSFTLSGSKTLSANDGAADEARARYLNITGGTGGTVTIPNVEKVYLVRNNSSGTVTFTTGSGTTADVAASDIQWVFCEAGNVVRATAVLTAGAAATLTNKTVDLTDNTLTGTTAEFNSALSDGDFATLAGSETLTNKTLTSPVVNSMTAASTVQDSGGTGYNVGYRDLPVLSASSARALVMTDISKTVLNTTGGWSIPANASVAFPVGTVISLYNDSGSAQNVTITSDTLRQAGTANTGTRSIPGRGFAAIHKVKTTEWIIMGTDLA